MFGKRKFIAVLFISLLLVGGCKSPTEITGDPPVVDNSILLAHYPDMKWNGVNQVIDGDTLYYNWALWLTDYFNLTGIDSIGVSFIAGIETLPAPPAEFRVKLEMMNGAYAFPAYYNTFLDVPQNIQTQRYNIIIRDYNITLEDLTSMRFNIRAQIEGNDILSTPFHFYIAEMKIVVWKD